MANDPIQGLIDFVLAQKPFHTKILDVNVNYTHEDLVVVTIPDVMEFTIDMFFETLFSDNSGSPESIIETCPSGFGDTWDQPAQFIVVYGNFSTDTVYFVGDVTSSFAAGVPFIVQDPNNIDPDLNFTTVSATYNSLTDRTAVPVAEDILPGDFIVNVAPPNNDNTLGWGYIVYDVVSTAISGNQIIITQTDINIDDFVPGFGFAIFGASDSALNKSYRIVAISTGPGVDQLTIFSSENVLADSTGDGQMTFAGFGYDVPPWCSSPQGTVVRPIISETLDIETLSQPGDVPSYQYYIISADTGTNTFTVQGDVRSNIAVTDSIDVINAVAVLYVPPAPLVPSANNGTYTVTSVTFDPITYTSAIGVASVPAATGTGFIVPT